MSNIDQIALDIIDNWEIDSLSDNPTQAKAKLQVAIVYGFKELEQENQRLRDAIEKEISWQMERYGLVSQTLTQAIAQNKEV